ncbi:hypothetical protein M0811_07676 [Anaeramoeba ignava]|uniref:Uncharacterized protein n=1 Tax=Anaeramoeba ignava TaxID=1746090 RepID=A0A9Q0LL87_ANAIG|nr:hypothetical protein M0811_07676 [Anaeramoeba ignava]
MSNYQLNFSKFPKIVVLDEKEIGKNIRKLAVSMLTAIVNSWFLDRVMQVLGIKWDSTSKDPNAYYLKETIPRIPHFLTHSLSFIYTCLSTSSSEICFPNFESCNFFLISLFSFHNQFF